MPHITDYRITLAIGVVIMALTFVAFRFVGNWFNNRARQSEESGGE